MKFQYGLDEKPPLSRMLLLGLQWLAVTFPILIIMGKILAGLNPDNPAIQTSYLQRMFFVAAVALFVQIIWGHRLPIISGPSAVLLVGIAAAQGSSSGAINTSIIVGGLALALLGFSGAFAHLQKLFTHRVVAVILILVALTLSPMILNLIITPSAGVGSFANLCFALLFVGVMFIASSRLSGILKATLIVWAMPVGTIVYYLVFRQTSLPTANLPLFEVFWQGLTPTFSLDWGVLLSFMVCYLALAVNDFGSIQSVDQLINPPDMSKRITRGMGMTGLVNILSGALGVIGFVNYSFSPGMITASGSASRYTLLPAGIGLLILSFLPKTVSLLGSIPPVVIGASLIFLMCSQLAAGLQMIVEQEYTFNDGLILGLPLMLGVIAAYMPAAAVNTFPSMMRPILGNGFVVGVLAVLFMEHVVYHKPV